MNVILSVDNLIALTTLTGLEIVLGIDNVIFIALVSTRLPENQQRKVRIIGLALAGLNRIILLFVMSWLIQLNDPFLTLAGWQVSIRELILLAGGLFLFLKATYEIRQQIADGRSGPPEPKALRYGAASAILQIIALDMVFSLDSVITAVGMVESVWIMVASVLISIVVMIAFASRITKFVDRHPSMKILALAFMALIGAFFVADAFGLSIHSGYLYVAMGFALTVELLNIRARERRRGDDHDSGG